MRQLLLCCQWWGQHMVSQEVFSSPGVSFMPALGLLLNFYLKKNLLQSPFCQNLVNYESVFLEIQNANRVKAVSATEICMFVSSVASVISPAGG